MHDHRKLLSRNAFAASALTLVGVLGGGAASARTASDECLARQSPLQAAALCTGVGAAAGAVHAAHAAHYRGAASDGVRMATITTASAHRNLQPRIAFTIDTAEPEAAYA
ncbi:hypothetical protein ACFX58_19230 [Sphingomonas sp. NCPPB 2930]